MRAVKSVRTVRTIYETSIDKILRFSLYDHFFTGRSLKDQGTRELLLLLLDLGSSLGMEEAEVLLDNLLQFCGFYANWESNQDKSREDLVGAAGLEWSG